MNNLVYVLFSCDEWKSITSMRLIGVFTLNRLLKQLKEEIKLDNMEFNRDCLTSLDISEINDSLVYGMIVKTTLNEIL